MSVYVPIRVSTLRGDQDIGFDTYVKVNDKFILYLRKGDSFEGERLQRLKEKKLRQMFILPEDEHNYRSYLTRNIDMAYDAKSGKSLPIRAAIIQGHQQSKAESVFDKPDDEFVYADAKDSVKKFISFLEQEDPHAIKAILDIENFDQNIAHHGVTVSTYALALAKKLKIKDPGKLQLLTLGALLHDFEHFHSSLAINRPLKDFNEAELEIYKKHPALGAAKVKDKKHFDLSVINIILQHEEYIDGRGFPNQLNEIKCDPLAVIVGSANALDRIITFENIPRAEAAKKLMMTSVGRHPLKHLQMLGDIMTELKFT